MSSVDPLLKRLLDAPVGQVESTLQEILNSQVFLDIIEQNAFSGTKFVRKITITANDLPLIRAIVRFDSKVIPSNILSELLRKKDGVGTILKRNNINAERKVISLTFSDNEKATRNYQIIHDSSIWFEISEEIRLDYISACKNST